MISQLEIITNEVCKFYRINPDAIQTKNRKKELVRVRQICHYLAKKHTKLSFSVIGSEIGGKNYTTVMYGNKLIKSDIIYYTKIAEDIDTLNDIIEPKLNNRVELLTPKIKEYIYKYMTEDLTLDFGNIILHFSKNYIKL